MTNNQWVTVLSALWLLGTGFATGVAIVFFEIIAFVALRFQLFFMLAYIVMKKRGQPLGRAALIALGLFAAIPAMFHLRIMSLFYSSF
jgi:hypothetical protein